MDDKGLLFWYRHFLWNSWNSYFKREYNKHGIWVCIIISIIVLPSSTILAPGHVGEFLELTKVYFLLFPVTQYFSWGLSPEWLSEYKLGPHLITLVVNVPLWTNIMSGAMMGIEILRYRGIEVLASTFCENLKIFGIQCREVIQSNRIQKSNPIDQILGSISRFQQSILSLTIQPISTIENFIDFFQCSNVLLVVRLMDAFWMFLSCME